MSLAYTIGIIDDFTQQCKEIIYLIHDHKLELISKKMGYNFSTFTAKKDGFIIEFIIDFREEKKVYCKKYICSNIPNSIDEIVNVLKNNT